MLGFYVWIFFKFLGGGIKSGVNIWMYYGVMDKHHEPDLGPPVNPDINKPIVVFASVFLVLDFMCAYFVLLVILLIPYQW